MTEDLKDELLREMEAAAKGATPGVWELDDAWIKYDGMLRPSQNIHAPDRIIGSTEVWADEDGHENGAHVAASHPANVLALIARLHRAEADATSLRAERDAAVEALARINRMRLFPDDVINRTTLLSAIKLARAVVEGQS